MCIRDSSCSELSSDVSNGNNNTIDINASTSASSQESQVVSHIRNSVQNNSSVSQTLFDCMDHSMDHTNQQEPTELIIDNLAAIKTHVHQPQVNQGSSLTCYTTGQKCVVSLMRILDKMNAPDYAVVVVLATKQ